METIYLVGKVNKMFNFVGTLKVFSTKEKAEEYRNYCNELYKTNEYVVEKHHIE